MGYEHLSITPETESDEVTESNAENLLPILSECMVALEDKRECDLLIFENSPVGNKIHKAFPLPGESSHWQYKFPLLVEGVPTARRMEIPLPGVCTAMMKKLPVKDRWQLHKEDGICLAHDSSSNCNV
uniref:Reverse transcriptase domain-containing protein n=1 Tax=Tanacetum cinerariifolium TaxID=118510 RepID=A0A699QD68_TANCI|nr:hypothetical protein [Tanacetum cinerariifolium]